MRLRCGQIDENPETAEARRAQCSTGFFDKPTFFKLLAALPDDGLRDFVEWAFWTGMRKGEIAA